MKPELESRLVEECLLYFIGVLCPFELSNRGWGQIVRMSADLNESEI
jgi:hypothetical protein